MTRIKLCNLSALVAMPKTEMTATTGGTNDRGHQNNRRGDSHKYYRYCGRFSRRYPWWLCQFGRFGR